MAQTFEGLPRGHFACIAADPPWNFKSRTPLTAQNAGARRDAEKHYPVMPIADIAAMPVSELAARDAHLFLWTTGPFLRASFDVMDGWGFNYSGIGFVWVKAKKTHGRQLELMSSADIERTFFLGLGHTTRKNCEFVLLGRRGSPKRLAKDVRELIFSPLREHSRKPDEFFQRVERYCDGPRLELFSREEREGWTAWGNQTEKFQKGALPASEAA